MASFANHFILRQIEFNVRAAIWQLRPIRHFTPIQSAKNKKRSPNTIPISSSIKGFFEKSGRFSMIFEPFLS